MKAIIRREDLTATECKAITDRYAPYHRFEEFWTGYYAYQNETGRYRCPYGWSHSVPSRAWHYGHDAAMHVRWERKIPARDEYERDDRDTEKLREGFRAAREEMKRKGTLPARKPRPCERC